MKTQEQKDALPTDSSVGDYLQKASDAIYGARHQDYGDVRENFQRIADIWSVVLGREITTREVGLCMIGLKIARLVNTPDHEDSWVDIAGYAGLAEYLN